MTTKVLYTLDLPTITEIYNLIFTGKNSSPNKQLPLTITKSIEITLAPLFKIIIEESLTYGRILIKTFINYSTTKKTQTP